MDKREKEFCEEFCISQATMELVNTTRSNIVGHLRAMGIVKTRGVNDMRDLNSNSKEWVFVKAALVGGLYPNLVFVDRTSNKLFCRFVLCFASTHEICPRGKTSVFFFISVKAKTKCYLILYPCCWIIRSCLRISAIFCLKATLYSIYLRIGSFVVN